jgi:nucleoside-diphosphate-sugar epimerase
MITGGAGFIGSQLGLHLQQQGHEILLVDNMRYGHVDNLLSDGKPFATFIGRDVRDPSLTGSMKGVETIFHFAAISSLPECQVNPREAYDVNVGGTAAVLELARASGVKRVIMASTSAVYENTKAEVLHETDVATPDLVYAMTKLSAEHLCAAYAKNYGLDVIICRFFNTYGAHQDMARANPPFTSYLARELALGHRPTLYNKSDVKRDYIYVGDLIALLQLMLHDPAHFDAATFNICSGTGYSVPELVALAGEIAGKTIDPIYADPKKFWQAYTALTEGPHALRAERLEQEVFKHVIGSSAKAQQRFGWAPRTPMRDGLSDVIRYANAYVARRRA